MNLDELLHDAHDSLTVKKVYGEPYEKNGVTLIPAAVIRGGGGAGEGEDGEASQGSGGGFGLTARPVGAYEIHGNNAHWIPAVDVTKIVIATEVFGMATLLLGRSIYKMRQKAMAA